MISRPPIGYTDFPGQQPQQPLGGFIWGAGGAQLTPEQLADRQRMAMGQMAPDFSPVEGGVLGALGRAAQNIYGAVQLKGINKQQAAANADAQSRITATLGKDADLAPLFTGGDKVAASLASDVFNLRNPKPQAPSEFDRTLAGAGIDPHSQQGVALYAQRANTLASPAPQFVSDGMGGGRWVQPPALGMQGGGDPTSTAPGLTPVAGAPQVGMIEDGYRFMGGNPADPKSWEQVQGGPTPPASGSFPL